MRIVLNTNVLVSGLLNPSGIPGRIVDLIMGGSLTLIYDDRILAEYEDVLTRPHLKIEKELSIAVLSFFRLSGERVTAMPLSGELLPDPDDIPFVEVALSGKAEALITGNLKHFKGAPTEVVILSPAEFITRFS